ncbi:MAG TPA: hypothetical protein VNZ55_04230 [Thermomicrobiales bacterium]|nr:hypothetical protein [Thermomicrobiales bacterium]
MTDRYAIIGDISANKHDATLSPGGALAIALAIRDLGGNVTLRSVLATDDAGNFLRDFFRTGRIHPGLVDRPANAQTAIVHRDDHGAVVAREDGVGIEKGAVMDVYALFGHDALVLDTRDQPLRRFLTDLPAHTDGNVRMISTLGHLDWNEPTPDEMEIALRCDVIIGTASQLAVLTGQDSPSEALGDIFDRMPGAHVRAAVAVTEAGIDLVAREDRVIRPVRDIVPDLLLPQVAAGIAWGLAHHAPWELAASVAVDPSQRPG